MHFDEPADMLSQIMRLTDATRYQAEAPEPRPRDHAGARDGAVGSDEQLCQQVVAGNLSALGQLYDQHRAPLRVFARRLVGEEAAEDLVHDTFLSLPRALARYHGKGALRSFILGVAVNHARHRVRARARFGFAIARLAREPQPLPSNPEQGTEQRKLGAALQRALASLSFDHRTAFVLCEVEERSSPEVAEILGIPEATVRTRLFHAKRKLRAALLREGVR